MSRQGTHKTPPLPEGLSFSLVFTGELVERRKMFRGKGKELPWSNNGGVNIITVQYAHRYIYIYKYMLSNFKKEKYIDIKEILLN